MKPASSAALHALGISLLCLVVYGAGLQGEVLNWDDHLYLSDPVLKASLPEALRLSFTEAFNGGYYPLFRLSFWAQSAAGLEGPLAFHAFDLLIFLATVLLVRRAFFALELSPAQASLGALLFALHPLRVEQVVWISARKDALALLFFVAAVVLLLEKRKRSYVFLAFLLAVLSKSTFAFGGFALIGVVALLESPRTAARRLWPIGLSSVAAALAGRWAHGTLPRGVSHAASETLGERLSQGASSVAAGLGRLVYPRDLSAIYSQDSSGPTLWLGLALLLGVVALTITRYLKHGERWPAVLLAASLLVLLPYAGLVDLGWWGCDRYFALSALGLTYLFTRTVLAPAERRFGGFKTSAAILVLVIAPLCWTTVVRVGHWRDSETLWRVDVSRPGKVPARHLNLASALGARSHFAEAAAELETARQLAPEDAVVFARWIFASATAKSRGPTAALTRLLFPAPSDRAGWLEVARELEKQRQCRLTIETLSFITSVHGPDEELSTMLEQATSACFG